MDSRVYAELVQVERAALRRVLLGVQGRIELGEGREEIVDEIFRHFRELC
jgi:hypothetical protein